MAWRWPGDKPLSEPMRPDYWRIYTSLGPGRTFSNIPRPQTIRATGSNVDCWITAVKRGPLKQSSSKAEGKLDVIDCVSGTNGNFILSRIWTCGKSRGSGYKNNFRCSMMTSSNGSIFRGTGLTMLYGVIVGHMTSAAHRDGMGGSAHTSEYP